MALRRGYTVVSVRTCSKFCVTFVKSQSLRKRCISSTRLLEFPNPMQISSLRVYMLWNHVKTFKSSLFRVPWAIWTQVWRWCCLLGTPPQVSHQTPGMSRQFALLAAATSKTKRCCFLLLSERYFMLLRAQKTFEAYGRLVAALGLYLIFVFLRPIDSSSQWKIYKHLLIEKSREISLRIFKILNIQCCNVSLSESRPKKQFFKPRLFASCPRQGESKPALFQKSDVPKVTGKRTRTFEGRKRTKNDEKYWRERSLCNQPNNQLWWSTIWILMKLATKWVQKTLTLRLALEGLAWWEWSPPLWQCFGQIVHAQFSSMKTSKQQAQKNIQSTNVPNKPLPSVWVSWCLQSPDNLGHFCTSLPQFLQDLKSWNMWNLELMEHSSTHSTPPVYFVRFVQIRRDQKIADLNLRSSDSLHISVDGAEVDLVNTRYPERYCKIYSNSCY